MQHQAKEVISVVGSAKSIFFIGRNSDYAVALEGSLKLKEISYIHSEAYAAGEMKHGTISLIEPGTKVIAICTPNGLSSKTQSNIDEAKARGAEVTAITCTNDTKADIIVITAFFYAGKNVAIVYLYVFAVVG